MYQYTDAQKQRSEASYCFWMMFSYCCSVPGGSVHRGEPSWQTTPSTGVVDRVEFVEVRRLREMVSPIRCRTVRSGEGEVYVGVEVEEEDPSARQQEAMDLRKPRA